MKYYPFLNLIVLLSLTYSLQDLGARASNYGKNKGLHVVLGLFTYAVAFLFGYLLIQFIYSTGNDELLYYEHKRAPASSAMKTLSGLIFGGLSVYGLGAYLESRWKESE